MINSTLSSGTFGGLVLSDEDASPRQPRTGVTGRGPRAGTALWGCSLRTPQETLLGGFPAERRVKADDFNGAGDRRLDLPVDVVVS